MSSSNPSNPIQTAQGKILNNNQAGKSLDYRRRQQAEKTIGSEKGVDVVVGRCQKNKGMSGDEKGSRALAILKTVELNGRWQPIWIPQIIAE